MAERPAFDPEYLAADLKAALMFFTRLPIPNGVAMEEGALARATWAAPVAGVVVGVVNGVSSALSFYGIKVFPAVILGGLDSVVGAVLGGLIVGLLENWAQYLDAEWLNWGNMYTIAPFYALILILLVKPYGLFGTRNIERV